MQAFVGHVGAIESVKWTHDGRMVVSAGEGGAVLMWAFLGDTVRDVTAEVSRKMAQMKAHSCTRLTGLCGCVYVIVCLQRTLCLRRCVCPSRQPTVRRMALLSMGRPRALAPRLRCRCQFRQQRASRM